MTDLSTLSDADLVQQYQQSIGGGPAPTPPGFTGQRITVGATDPSKMSDDELRKAYDSHQPSTGDVLWGLGQAGGVGIAKGAIGLAGLPGDLQTLAGKAGDWLKDHLPSLPEPDERTKRYAEKYGGRGDIGPSFPLPTSKDIQGVVEKATGPFREPQTQGERDAETAGEFLPAALAGPGGIARKIVLQDALPATASIVAGRYTDQNPYVKALAGFLAGGAGAMASGPSSVQEIIRSKIPASVTEQDITRAGQLIEHAQQRGVSVPWPEALSRVTGQPVLTDTMRVLESHPQTRGTMNEFFADRPAQVENAVRSELNKVSAVPPDPHSLGREASEAARETVKGVKGQITAASDPYYKAAESVLLTPHEMALVKTIPGYQEARDAVRSNKQLNSYVGHLPDNSVGFLNEVKQWFDTQARNSVSKFNPQANSKVEAVHSKAARAIKEIGELKSQDYAIALGIQSDLRTNVLQKIMDSPLGRLAEKDATTRKAIEVLFPSNPLAHSQGDVRSAVYSIAQKRPAVAEQLVATHAEMVFNEAMRELQGGANQFSGARFAKAIAGNPQQRENLKAAFEALPNGTVRWEGFERLLDIMSATGTRQPKGSLTAFNTLEVGNMSSGGLQQLAATAASPSKWMKVADDTFKSWSAGRNLDGLARLLTDPRAVEAFRQIVRVPAGSDRALVMAGRLINQLGAATTEQRNQPPQANGR